jgi:hypothetical protein
MIEIGLSLGLIIAGIAWFIRDLPGILSAPRTARIRSKSYGAPLLRRVVLLALVILGIARMAATAG